MLIETLIALKMAELDDLAALLTHSPKSVRALAQMRPDRWVEHLAELALIERVCKPAGGRLPSIGPLGRPDTALAGKGCTKTFYSVAIRYALEAWIYLGLRN